MQHNVENMETVQGTDITVQELCSLMLAHVHQQGVWLSPALVVLHK